MKRVVNGLYIVAVRSGSSPTFLLCDHAAPGEDERLIAVRNGNAVGFATLRAFLGRGGVPVRPPRLYGGDAEVPELCPALTAQVFNSIMV